MIAPVPDAFQVGSAFISERLADDSKCKKAQVRAEILVCFRDPYTTLLRPVSH